MKKLIFGLGLLFGASLVQAQTGTPTMFNGVTVEKFHVATTADNTADPTLPVGAVTYRIYVKVKNHAYLQMVYGSATHPLTFSTTTTFFNKGTSWHGDQVAASATGSTLYDSWLSLGGVNDSYIGVPVSENAAGQVAGSPAGFSTTSGAVATDALPLKNVAGSTVSIIGDAYSTTDVDSGATSSHSVLIGQFTTDGTFTYAINLQLSDGVNPAEVYVSNNSNIVTLNPGTDGRHGEFYNAALAGTYAPNVAPAITFTVPTGDTTMFVNTPVTLKATATDAGSTGFNGAPAVTGVVFKAGGVVIPGVVTQVGSVYSLVYTPASTGVKNITAEATDNDGATTVAAATKHITVNANAVPVLTGLTATGAHNPAKKNELVSVTVNATDDGSVASVSFVLDGTTVAGTKGSGNAWTASFTPTTEGSKTITAQATDNLSATSTIASTAIVIYGNSKYLISDTTVNCSQDLIELPVKLVPGATLTNCTGIDMQIHFDPTLVTPTLVVKNGKGLAGAQFIADADVVLSALVSAPGVLNITMAQSASNNANAINATNGGELLTVEFAKTPAYTPSATSAAVFTFNGTDVLESYLSAAVSHQTGNGGGATITVAKANSYTAGLSFWSDYSPITNTANDLTTTVAPATGSAITLNADGTFTFPIAANNVSISRDIASATDVMPVINGYDAFLVEKVLLQDPTFTPSVYQIIAMDVNMDGMITAGDLSQINKRSVAIEQNFSSNRDWVFVDRDTLANAAFLISKTYPANDASGYSKFSVPVIPAKIAAGVSAASTEGECPVYNDKTIVGILMGDANGNYANLNVTNMGTQAALSTLKADVTATSVDGNVVFDLSQAVTKDGSIDVPVYISSKSTINALDFALTYGKNLTFDQVVNQSSSLKSLAYYNENDNTLRFTSYDLAAFSTESPIVTVRFKMAADSVVNSDINTTKAYLNGEPVSSSVKANGAVWNNNSAQVVTVFPNPSHDVLNIHATQNATAELFDVIGRVILEIPTINANETKTVSISGLPIGTYVMKVFNEKTTTIVKVIVK